MRVFLLDLWLDLREKRLAPIAILLLAGIIIVPIALSKNSKEATPPPTTTTTAAAPAAPVVTSEATGTTSSKLQTYTSKDPFEAPVPTSTTAPATGTTGSSGSSSSSGTSSSGTSSSGTSGGATNGTQPTTGTTGNTGSTTGETKTTLFTYTTDLRFGQGGDVALFKNVKRLQLVPSEKDPKIVFLGVTTSGKTAVFLVDSNIGVDTAGGVCKPNPDQCTFLYLRPDSDHNEAQLTDSDGTVYHMRLLAIHRVTVSSSSGGTTNTNSGNSNGNSKSNRSPAFTGRADRKAQSGADATTPGGDAPPGEPNKQSSFQQFFADGSSDTSSPPSK
jgi:hypothetical protein